MDTHLLKTDYKKGVEERCSSEEDDWGEDNIAG